MGAGSPEETMWMRLITQCAPSSRAAERENRTLISVGQGSSRFRFTESRLSTSFRSSQRSADELRRIEPEICRSGVTFRLIAGA